MRKPQFGLELGVAPDWIRGGELGIGEFELCIVVVSRFGAAIEAMMRVLCFPPLGRWVLSVYKVRARGFEFRTKP